MYILHNIIACDLLHPIIARLKTLQRSTDSHCALDMCNTARIFTHESNTYVIWRLAFLNLGCIDLLSCTPLPATFLSHHFWTGCRVWVQPNTVFGKHCECNAQKCTNLKRLPPLASHLLLLSHDVLTQHEGPKKHVRITWLPPGVERTTHGLSKHASVNSAIHEIEPDGSYFPIVADFLKFKSHLVTKTEKFS